MLNKSRIEAALLNTGLSHKKLHNDRRNQRWYCSEKTEKHLVNDLGCKHAASWNSVSRMDVKCGWSVG